jgi:ribosome-associated toxin RatA of RatAB toxin-antitoxin module
LNAKLESKLAGIGTIAPSRSGHGYSRLTGTGIRAPNEALDDEYRACATSDQVIADFGEVRPFSNIRRAAARHIDAPSALSCPDMPSTVERKGIDAAVYSGGPPHPGRRALHALAASGGSVTASDAGATFRALRRSAGILGRTARTGGDGVRDALGAPGFGGIERGHRSRHRCPAYLDRNIVNGKCARRWMASGGTTMRSARAYALALAVAAAQAAGAATVTIEAERDGDGINIRASAVLNADGATAWRVLTDYNRYTEFIPDLRSSRVAARRGATVTVEQSGDAALWWFRIPLNITFEVNESPPSRLQSRAVAGTLRALTSSYALMPAANGTRLDYVGRIAPGFELFGRIEQTAVEQNIARQFQALADEIERQAAAAR